MIYIADTNIISETNRPKPNKQVQEWLENAERESLFTTTVALAEIRAGILLLKDTSRARELDDWLSATARSFLDRVFPADEDSLVIWHDLMRRQQKRRISNPPVDILIAAIALRNGAVVATRDTKPFAACGVPVFNPFTGERFNGA